MVNRKDLLSIGFYKKIHFTGSVGNMNYRIAKHDIDKDLGTKEFVVTIFPGPFCYEETDDSLKQTAVFPFEAESLDRITDYLNEQYVSQKALWDTVRML